MRSNFERRQNQEFKSLRLSIPAKESAGAFVDTQDNIIAIPQAVAASQPGPAAWSFTLGDILWAIGIWSVIICLSPVIVFYVLMVA